MGGSVFGMTAVGDAIPLAVSTLVLVLIIGFLLVVMFLLIVGLSVYYSVKRTRRNRVRTDLRTELLDRLFANTPRWEEWVAGLTAVEREVVESLLDDHLRELDGADADTLRGCGEALGIPERAGRQLETGEEYDRLRALTWLTLLRKPEPYFESSFAPKTPRERASVVRLLLQTDTLPDSAAGISILLDGIDQQFTVFGQDTLYRIALEDPEPLLRTANDAYDGWPEPLLTQVLSVCGELETSVREGELSWITAVLETGDEATRAAAAEALSSFGWRTSLRDQTFFKRAVNDPSPQVRAAVYEMLASWGDNEAVGVLLDTLLEETDPRALTVGTKALIRRRDSLDADASTSLGDAWTWATEHAAYDRLARRGRADGGWGRN